MPHIVLDDMSNTTSWAALEADGVTPSTALAVQVNQIHYRYGPDEASGQVSATSGAAGHFLQRALPNVDLGNFDQLRFWISSDRQARGTPAAPFYLQVRLGSAAVGFDDPANTWQRFVAVGRTGTWELINLRLADLPANVRSSVNGIRLTCVDDSAPFQCFIDDVMAVREEMLRDIDQALVERLHQHLTMNGTPVPAQLVLALAPPAAQPVIRILNYDIDYAKDRAVHALQRSDYSPARLLEGPPTHAYDVMYAIQASSNQRTQQAEMLEFILRRLPPKDELLVNGVQLQIERVRLAPDDMLGGDQHETVLLYYRVSARQEAGTATAARAVTDVEIATHVLPAY